MDKPAPTAHPIHALLAGRWSPRAFDAKPVDKATLARCFEAARWAPSCFNEQPWSFVVAAKDDAGAYAKLLDCLVPFNQAWAGQADVLAIGVSSKQFARNQKPNGHDRHDLGMAMMSLSLQAEAEGLATHMMAGFDPEKARQAFGIPQTHDAVTAMAIGHPGDPSMLPEEAREQETGPRSRKALDQFVFGENFGAAVDWV